MSREDGKIHYGSAVTDKQGSSLDEPFTHYPIAEIIPSMHRTVEELKEAFEKGLYGLLVCDDLSARVPTEILRGVMDHINEKHGRPPTPVVYVRPAYNTVIDFIDDTDHRAYHDDFLEPEPAQRLPDADTHRLTTGLQTLHQGQRALAITDHMASGAHIRLIGAVIHGAGVLYDVVALSRIEKTQYYRDTHTVHATEEIFPTSGHLTHRPAITGKHELTGFATHLGAGTIYVNPHTSQATLRSVRTDVQKAVKQLIVAHKL